MTQYSKRESDGPFYRDLGSAIRLARLAAGKTQTEVAEEIDVSFQQFQKYESGKNRIPVEELARVAAFLELPVAHFLAPTDSSDSQSALRSLIEDLSNKEFRAFLEFWKGIKDRGRRTAILDLFMHMAAALSR